MGCSALLGSAIGPAGVVMVGARPGSLGPWIEVGVACLKDGLLSSDEQGNVLHDVAAVAEAVPVRPVGLGAAGEIGCPGP
jgi:hypothetical protein